MNAGRLHEDSIQETTVVAALYAVPGIPFCNLTMLNASKEHHIAGIGEHANKKIGNS